MRNALWAIWVSLVVVPSLIPVRSWLVLLFLFPILVSYPTLMMQNACGSSWGVSLSTLYSKLIQNTVWATFPSLVLGLITFLFKIDASRGGLWLFNCPWLLIQHLWKISSGLSCLILRWFLSTSNPNWYTLGCIRPVLLSNTMLIQILLDMLGGWFLLLLWRFPIQYLVVIGYKIPTQTLNTMPLW